MSWQYSSNIWKSLAPSTVFVSSRIFFFLLIFFSWWSISHTVFQVHSGSSCLRLEHSRTEWKRLPWVKAGSRFSIVKTSTFGTSASSSSSRCFKGSPMSGVLEYLRLVSFIGLCSCLPWTVDSLQSTLTSAVGCYFICNLFLSHTFSFPLRFFPPPLLPPRLPSLLCPWRRNRRNRNRCKNSTLCLSCSVYHSSEISDKLPISQIRKLRFKVAVRHH